MYHVPLKEIIDLFHLEILTLPEEPVNVTCMDVNRPGLPLTGFYDHFEPQRIQIIGKVEHLFLSQLEPENFCLTVPLQLSSPQALRFPKEWLSLPRNSTPRFCAHP